MFNVVCIETLELVAIDGRVLSFETGTLAAECSAKLTTETGKKHQPRRAPSNVDWRERERARFADGTYTALPAVWDGNAFFSNFTQDLCEIYGSDFDRLVNVYGYTRDRVEQNNARRQRLAEAFAHVSRGKQGKIAYTVDTAAGEADRQTVVSPGVFLQRFFGDVLDAGQIALLAAWFSDAYGDPAELFVTSNADEIEEVYTSGPRSCMSASADEYDSHCHPSRVYAGPDLAVAYIKNSRDEISARSVVWPEKKYYSRIYGDTQRMAAALARAGYSDDGSLDGARILKIENRRGGGYVMPYIDDCAGADFDGEFFSLGGSDVDCRNTNGLTETGPICDNCNDRTSEDDCYSVETSRRRYATQTWCSSCCENDAFYCEVAGEYIANSLGVEMSNGECWSPLRYDREGFECEYTNERYHVDDAVSLDNGTVTWSQDAFDRHGYTCPECGQMFTDKSEANCCDCPETDDTAGESSETNQDADNVRQWAHLKPGDMVRIRHGIIAKVVELDPDGAGAIHTKVAICDGSSGFTFEWLYDNEIESLVSVAPTTPDVPSAPAFKPGDLVQLKPDAVTLGGANIHAWRSSNGFPPADSCIFRVKEFYANGNGNGGTLYCVRRDGFHEVWDAGAWEHRDATTDDVLSQATARSAA